MRVIGRLILSAVLLVLTGLLMAVAAFLPELFFSFYTDFSKGAMNAISAVTGKLPFALWEWVVVVVVLLGLYFLIRKRHVVRWLSGLLLYVSAFVFLFMALWGLNYFAPAVRQPAQDYSVQTLKETALYLAAQANATADQVPRDENGRMKADFDHLASIASDGYDVLAQEDPFFSGSREPVKKLLSGKLFSYMGFTGIFVPWTAESSINADISAMELPFTMCHELAHRLTVAREDEANFCAFLASIHNPAPEFQYSGWYQAYLHVYSALYQADSAAALETADLLSSTVRQDMMAEAARDAKYDSAFQDAAQKANDLYLKAAGDPDGDKSYGKVTDLLVAWYLEQE